MKLTPAEIIEGNKLIAEFMGYTVYYKRYPKNHGIGGGTLEPQKDCIVEKCKYHSSWDWLMPAWYKFRDIIIEPDKPLSNLRAKHQEHLLNFLNTIIWGHNNDTPEECFNELVNSIKWYNTQKS